MLELDISVERRDLVVEIAFAVAPGSTVALFGPSGAGKTTVLETVAGLVTPHRGRITLGDRLLTETGPGGLSLAPWQRRIGLLSQHAALFPHLSVAENLAYDRTGGGQEPSRLKSVATRLGLGALLDARPASLSGGQAQRAAICRLLLANVQALLLDEPYAGLDAELRRVVAEMVTEAVRTRDLPAVLVAHELADAQSFGDRLGIMSKGRLLQIGEPHEIVARPSTRRVAELVGYRSFLAFDQGRSVLAVHPERVVPGGHPERGIVITGTVSARRASGARFEVDLVLADDIGGQTVVCELAELPPSTLLTVTVLDPPVFSATDGSRVDPRRPPGLTRLA